MVRLGPPVVTGDWAGAERARGDPEGEEKEQALGVPSKPEVDQTNSNNIGIGRDPQSGGSIGGRGEETMHPTKGWIQVSDPSVA